MKALICTIDRCHPRVALGKLTEAHLPWPQFASEDVDVVAVMDRDAKRVRLFKNRITGVAEIVARVQFDAWMWGE